MRAPERFLPFAVLAVAVCMLAVVNPGCSPAEHDAAVATVGKDAITLSEYEKLYLKNNTSRDDAAKTTPVERERFLDLLVNYRLKLNDAYRQKLDRRPDVMGELQQYKGSLAASFLTEREIVAPGVKHLFDQRNEEIRASHILISLTPKASADDSAAAYAKASMILGLLQRGALFDSLAVKFSDDPSAKNNRGDLYYFAAGTMVLPFEQAAFSMKVGEVTTTPVRSQFGLHIIKIVDRKPAPGEIRCAHIMVGFDRPNPAQQDTVAVYKKVMALKDSLAAGVDFAELAKRNSTDQGSASKGGDLGWFSRRRWVLPFDEVAFQLKPGQVSQVIRTAYGYHIIKALDARPRKTFEEAKDEVKQLYQQMRFKDDFARYVATLKSQLHFRMIDATVDRFIAACDTNKTTGDSDWAATIPPALGREAIMSVSNIPISVDSVVSIVKSYPDLGNTPLRSLQLRSLLDKVSEHLVFSARGESLERENPEFASIVRDYREGILLYQIEQEKVWNRIESSDSLLHLYYSAHSDRFAFPDRVSVTEIRGANETRAKEIHGRLSAGTTFESLAAEDSVRMSAPASQKLSFTGRSATLSADVKKSVRTIAAEMTSDPAVRLILTARPDTMKAKAEQTRLAGHRLEAITSLLTGKYGIPAARIISSTRARSPADSSAVSRIVTADITGRQALVVGKLATSLIPVKSDERANAGDTLAPGTFSTPFSFKGSWLIIRLNVREPARTKTFEEAGAEVSSSYQESESKRLEQEWLGGLRKEYPVVEHTEFLKEAFAPKH